MANNGDEDGNPAASKRIPRRLYICGRKEEEEDTITCESRIEAEKGRARKAAVEV